MDRHLFPTAFVMLISQELVGVVIHSPASPEQPSVLPILWENPIFGLQSREAAKHGSFLAETCHIEGNLVLALRLVENNVSRVHSDHLFVQVF